MRREQAIVDANADEALTQRTEVFLRELTLLTRKLGIGITGDATLFVLEEDDHLASYDCDDESNLRRKLPSVRS